MNDDCFLMKIQNGDSCAKANIALNKVKLARKSLLKDFAIEESPELIVSSAPLKQKMSFSFPFLIYFFSLFISTGIG